MLALLHHRKCYFLGILMPHESEQRTLNDKHWSSLPAFEFVLSWSLVQGAWQREERIVHPILFLNFTHFPQVTNEQTYNHHLTLLCQHRASDKLRSVSFSNKIKPGDRIGRQTLPSQLWDQFTQDPQETSRRGWHTFAQRKDYFSQMNLTRNSGYSWSRLSQKHKTFYLPLISLLLLSNVL